MSQAKTETVAVVKHLSAPSVAYRVFHVREDTAEHYVPWSMRGMSFNSTEEKEAISESVGYYYQEIVTGPDGEVTKSDPIGPYSNQFEAMEEALQ